MNSLKFTNGKFKIMQIADVQEDYPVSLDTIRLIDLALEKEMPDLVVFTGDQIQGYSTCYKTDTLNRVKTVIGEYIAPIAKRGIPFAITFGNHDDDCHIDKAKQLEIYSSFESFVTGEPRTKSDPGTHSLKIKNSTGEKDIFAIYLIDSNKKDENGAYAPVKKEQLEWLESEREKNSYLPALAFQHIPVPEFYKVLKKVPFYTKGAVEAYKSRKNTFWLLTGKEGFMGETPAVPEINTGEFEILKKHGDIMGLFVGHDHVNSFVRNLEGVDLGYTQGAGFNTYGPAEKRGVRIFELDENNTKDYKTYTVTAGELGAYTPSKPLKEFFFCKMPTSVDEVFTNLKRIAVASIAVTAIVKTIKALTK